MRVRLEASKRRSVEREGRTTGAGASERGVARKSSWSRSCHRRVGHRTHLARPRQPRSAPPFGVWGRISPTPHGCADIWGRVTVLKGFRQNSTFVSDFTQLIRISAKSPPNTCGRIRSKPTSVQMAHIRPTFGLIGFKFGRARRNREKLLEFGPSPANIGPRPQTPKIGPRLA